MAVLACLPAPQAQGAQRARATQAPGSSVAAPSVEYARDVLPILSDACYHCHGPDERARKASLRLDTREGAFRVRRGKTVLVPGKPDESELVRRLESADDLERMPPPESHRKVTPAQVRTVRRWVEQGAPWGAHWAFVPPRRAPLPDVARRDWPRADLDRFVLARLERQGLAPAPEAPRELWLRRVTLDLTGLPPTPAELDAFLADAAPDAFEKVVDRLLASPRYGERMAADWLDLARYADTHGYQMDRYRPMWPYRDWVISAFNRNLPYDVFVTWQLAGDLLPNATKEQRLATAFNRLHLQNEEGGIVEEEFRVSYVVDRANTFGTAFLGLTFDCARCHDHKYDPLTQKDYYSLFAFFQNIDESGQTTYFTDAMPVPTLLLSTDEQDRQLAELAAKIAAKERELSEARPAARKAFEAWRAKGPPATQPVPVAAYAFDELAGNRSPNSRDPKKPAVAHEGPRLVEGKRGKAVALDGENGLSFPGAGAFTRSDPFTLALFLRTPDHADRAVVLHKSRAPIDAGSRGYELLLERGRIAFGLHHMWPGNSLKVVAKPAVAINRWTHVAVTYDGSSRAAGVRIYLDGVAVEHEVVRDGLWKDITYGGGEPDLALGFRFRDNGFKGGAVDELAIFDRELAAIEVARLAGRPEDELAPDALFDLYLATAHEPSIKLRAELTALRRERARLINPIPEAMVMREMPTPRPAFILKRGAYDAPGPAVSMDTPAIFGPYPAGLPRNRLGLARWLFAPGHPLAARVAVNRLWQQMFGTGLVETSDNFGSQGAQPADQALLDHLALVYAEDLRWDTKAMLRLIALSATYRQSSRAEPDLLARDPANALLARGPSRRLTAEMLRDQALFAGGLLVEKQGGASVKPYQPDGLWDVAMGRPRYDTSKGEGLYRRSLYTFWKRTVPHPAMITFDAADRSICSVRRQATSTPLQALALLNDVQLVEAARFVGQRMLKEGGATPEARVGFAFRLLTARPPTAKESAVLQRLLAEQRDHYAADPAAARRLLAVGESKPDPALDPIDLAAATVLAQAILNHDAAAMRR